MTNNTEDVELIKEVLTQFAVATHEAKPGQDETPNFERALHQIQKIIERDVVGENEAVSRADGEPDDEAYLARFSRAVGRNGLRNKQRQAITNALYGKGVEW